jgi:hypothetical protein
LLSTSEPGCQPLELYNPVIQAEVFRDTIPWIVVRVGKQPPPVAASGASSELSPEQC